MVFDMIAMVSAGAGVAGIILVLRAILRGHLPRWALPAGIGAGMLAFSVWNEYSWYGRVTAALPPKVQVVLSPKGTSPFRPWTFVFPAATRFMALDRTVMQISATNPAIRQSDVMLVERWMPMHRLPVAFDCTGWRQADLASGGVLAPDGTLTGSDWVAADRTDTLQIAACNAD